MNHISQKDFGHNARRAKQVAVQTGWKTKVDDIIAAHDFTPEKVRTKETYETLLPVLGTEFKNIAQSKQRLIEAQSILQGAAAQIIRTNRLKCSLPQVPWRLVTPRQLRDEEKFRLSRSLHIWEEKFEHTLLSLDSPAAADPSIVLGLALYSAITRGGLVTPRMVKVLCDLLKNESHPLEKRGNYVFLSLKKHTKKGSFNLREGDENFHLHRWFPDLTSFALINRFLNLRNESVDVNISESPFDLIVRALFHSGRNKTVITSLNKLTSAGLWPAETSGKIDFSEALVNMASQDFPNFSMCPTSWENLFAEEPRIEYQPLETNPLSKSTRSKAALSHIPPEFNDFYSQLQEAITSPKNEGKPVSLRVLEDRLEQVRKTFSSSLPPLLNILLDWYIHLCSAKYSRIKSSSSILTYHRKLTKPWILHMYEQNLEAMDEDDFVEIYAEITSYRKTAEANAETEGLIARLHDFGMRNSYDLPYLSDWRQFSPNTQTHYVKAKIINHHLVAAAATRLTRVSKEHDLHEQTLPLITLLAFRTGLRIGEIVKLRLKDIDNGWIYVRTNQYGNNKSPSARRAIAAYVLLKTEEYKILQEYVSARWQQKTGPTAPVFSSPSGLPLKSTEVSQLIGNILKQVTGDREFVFHNLRHSAANVFHCVIENEWELARLISGLGDNRLRKIRAAIGGHDENHRDKYAALAQHMGHLSSSETMRSYLHFADLIISSKLTKGKYGLSRNQLSRITGVRVDNYKGCTPAVIQKQLIRKSKEFFRTPHKAPRNQKPQMALSHEPARASRHSDLFTAYRILCNLEQGLPPAKVSEIYATPLKIVEQYLEHAKFMHTLTTRKNNLRLFSKERLASFQADNVGNATGIPLTPTYVRGKPEWRELEKILHALRGQAKENGLGLIREWAWTVNNASNACHNKLYLYCQEKAASVITMLKEAIPLKRWRVDLQLYPGPDFKTQREAWREAFPPSVSIKITKKAWPRQKALYPQGIAHISLSHPAERNIVSKQKKFGRYSTNDVKFLAHMLSIIMGSPPDLRQTGD